MFGLNPFQTSVFGLSQPKGIFCDSFQVQNNVKTNNFAQGQFSNQGQIPFAALQTAALSLPPSLAPANRRRAPKARFSPADDELLRQTVAALGTSNWDAVAAQMPGRTPRMCHDRWTNYLDPSISHKSWTPEEDSLLLSKHSELGSRWVVISRFFPGRTDTQIKNRFLLLQRRIETGFFNAESPSNASINENLNNNVASSIDTKEQISPVYQTQAAATQNFVHENNLNNDIGNNNDFPCDFDFNAFDDADFSLDLF